MDGHWLAIVGCVIALAGCGADRSATAGLRYADHDPASSSEPASTASPATTKTSSSTTTAAPVEGSSHPDLSPIFALLGDENLSIEAIGQDPATGHYVLYEKSGEGPPAVSVLDTQPEVRYPFEFVDDGGGRHEEEQHAIVRRPYQSYDVYWNGHGITDVLHIGTDSDMLLARRPGRLFALGHEVIFDDTTDSADPNRSSVLRSHSYDRDAQEVVVNWILELPGTPIDVIPLGERGALISLATDGPTATEVSLVRDGRVSRSVTVPDGVLRLQTARTYTSDHVTCSTTEDFGAHGPHKIDWDMDASRQLLTACRDGVPIATTPWCCGMGEYFTAIDSNGDDILEVIIGGTSVGGGGGGVYSLVDDGLAPIRDGEGNDLFLTTGNQGTGIDAYGCVDGLLVQVSVRAVASTAWANRTFYEIDAHTAEVIQVERIDWTLAESIDPENPGALWDVFHDGPPEIVDELSDCDLPTLFPLAGTDTISVHLEPAPLTNARSCEVEWPRPYRRLVLEGAHGAAASWDQAGEFLRIDEADFISLPDGRFVFLESFICSHESTIKTIFSGSYDPATGALLALERIEPPPDYVYDGSYYRNHPDRLIVNHDGDIVGELDAGSDLLSFAISPSS